MRSPCYPLQILLDNLSLKNGFNWLVTRVKIHIYTPPPFFCCSRKWSHSLSSRSDKQLLPKITFPCMAVHFLYCNSCLRRWSTLGSFDSSGTTCTEELFTCLHHSIMDHSITTKHILSCFWAGNIYQAKTQKMRTYHIYHISAGSARQANHSQY